MGSNFCSSLKKSHLYIDLISNLKFQGEKNDGFNVLYQNMKGGITAARELGDFLRERAKVEEDNSKAQIKLANKLTPATIR